MSNELIPVPAHSSPGWRRRSTILTLFGIAIVALVLCAGICIRWLRSNSGTHSPWIYGSPSARFAIIEFGDLQCPYCRMYFPAVRAWVNEHSDVNWEWRYLPLAEHEPAATESARIAECSGEVGGSELFWYTLEWLQQLPAEQVAHPEGLYRPQTASAVQRCLRSQRPGSVVRAQRSDAARESINATPTFRLVDRQSGHTVTFTGMVSPDVLSSAIDSLAADR